MSKFIIIFLFLAGSVGAGELAPNRAELSLPMLDKKYIVAHFMTDQIHWTEQQSTWTMLENSDPQGATKAIGGMLQTETYPALLNKGKSVSLEEAVDYEIRAAQALGIDGYQFYFPTAGEWLSKKYAKIIRMFFTLAEKRYPNFKLTLCIFPLKPLAEIKPQTLAPIKQLMDDTADSPHWLKTPDGRKIFYVWNGDVIAGRISQQLYYNPKAVKAVAEGLDAFAEKMGHRIAYIYQVKFPDSERYVKAVLDYFPAVWQWTDGLKFIDEWLKLAQLCKERKRMYTQTVYPGYYTSKVYVKSSDPKHISHKILHTKEAVKAGVEGGCRHYQATKLSYLYRELLKLAVDTDAQLINFTTWNDYAEGHHLAPEANHNFGFAVLLDYYKKAWLNGTYEPVPDESVIAFYKKYAHDKTPKFNYDLITKSKVCELAEEDIIEVVTILREPAMVSVNGHAPVAVKGGLQVTTIPLEPGSVSVRVTRKVPPAPRTGLSRFAFWVEDKPAEQMVADFTCPQKITDTPYRTDRLTQTYSNRFNEYFSKIFGADRRPN